MYITVKEVKGTSMLDNITSKISSHYTASVLVMLVGFGSFIASILSERVGGYIPCDLCLLQRYSMLITGLLLASALYSRKQPKIFKTLYFAAMVVLLITFSSALYQLLIQYGLVAEPQFCKRNSGLYKQSIDEMLHQIEETQASGCKAFGPTFFGFPISAFSCCASLCSFLYMFICMMFNNRKSVVTL